MMTINSCTLLYCLIAGSMSGMAKLANFEPQTAIALAFDSVGSSWMSFVVYVSAFLGITASAFT
jgi:hypothetical protein